MSTAAKVLAPETEQCVEALLAGLKRMCSHHPLADERGPDLIPAPMAATCESGYIGLTSQHSWDHQTAGGLTIAKGDTLIIEPDGDYGPGDTVLVACVDDELTLANVRENDVLVWLREEEELNRARCLVIRPLVEVRRLSAAGKRLLAKAGAL